MMNLAMDQMDAVTGYIAPGPRIHLSSVVKSLQKAPVLNNVNVNNANIGMLNVGNESLSKIDAVITLSRGSDADRVGSEIQRITQAIVDAKELAETSKRELFELLQNLSQQIIADRQSSVAMTLLRGIEERAQGIAAVMDVFGTLSDAVKDYLRG